jgi:WhiB family redox-sensing transcriptional regulator
MTWRNRSACQDESPELFFPIGKARHAVQQVEAAKAVCARCQVVGICLSWAIDASQDDGVWGGLTDDERRALKGRGARAVQAS